MTTVKQICEELDIHFGRIEQVLPELKSYLPLEDEDFDNIEGKIF